MNPVLPAPSEISWPWVVALFIMSLPGIITAIVSIKNLQKTKENLQEVKEAKVERQEVKVELEKDTKASIKLAEKIHTLVNNDMGVVLREKAELARWKADQTEDPADIAAAEQAERQSADHQAKQAVVDKGDMS